MTTSRVNKFKKLTPRSIVGKVSASRRIIEGNKDPRVQEFYSIIINSLTPSRLVNTDANNMLVSSDHDDEYNEYFTMAVS